DPDEVLLEQEILNTIKKCGYEVVRYDDPISCRYTLEVNYRKFWDQNREAESAILIHSTDSIEKLPYDLFVKGRKVFCRLSDIFPNLSYPVIQKMDKSTFGTLFSAYNRYKPEKMGNYETVKFLLKHVYDLDVSIDIRPKKLLKWLFLRHFRTEQSMDRINPPELVDHYIIERLAKDSRFNGWPLKNIVPSKTDFFNFLQEQWDIFLNHRSTALIPFCEDDVRVYIDNFFLEGFLDPIKSTNPKNHPEWVKIGIIDYHAENAKRKFDHFIPLIKNHPKIGASINEWLIFSEIWAEFRVLINEYNIPVSGEIIDLCKEVESAFEKWLIQNYSSIHNIPYLPVPRMVHHINHYLASQKYAKDKKIALVVLDGMSMGDWYVVKRSLSRTDSSLRFDELPVFAWIPTITSISRQSIFAGNFPLHFQSSLDTTKAEKCLWLNFWTNEKGLSEKNVAYRAGLETTIADDIRDILFLPKIQIIGLVINEIDDIAHGLKVGIKGMAENVRLWMEERELANLIEELLVNEFLVFLASDHGNTETIGMGNPQQGVLVDTKFKRARIYKGTGAEEFRREISKKFSETITWPRGMGLPRDMFVLIAKPGLSFYTKGKKTVTHGGLTLEEVIVPFVEIRRNSN
ncbi:MAG: BREX-3 system phosphatase PglZ, partial [Candidatus Odinarchaeota archaeon]